MSARRYNKGKRRYDLIPTKPLADVADVFTRGAHKYTIYSDDAGNIIKGEDIPFEDAHKYIVLEDGAENWRNGLPWLDVIASAKRHITDWQECIDIDKDLKTKSLANAIWNLTVLLEYEQTHPELDNRIKPFLSKKRIGLDIDGVLADFVGHLMTVSGHPGHVPMYWNDPIVREAFEVIKREPTFWQDIPTLIDGSSLPFEPHCYITARSIGKDISEQWLNKNGFPKAPVYSIGAGESKVKIALDAGIDIFVDDSYDNFVELNRAGIFTYLYTASYNLKYDVGSQRVNSFADLKEKLRM